ncbi:hypothetical protein [Enterocloster sp. HCN-30185]
MASREELLQSIRPDMRLDKCFFLRIYGYELTGPGFSEVAPRSERRSYNE